MHEITILNEQGMATVETGQDGIPAEGSLVRLRDMPEIIVMGILVLGVFVYYLPSMIWDSIKHELIDPIE